MAKWKGGNYLYQGKRLSSEVGTNAVKPVGEFSYLASTFNDVHDPSSAPEFRTKNPRFDLRFSAVGTILQLWPLLYYPRDYCTVGVLWLIPDNKDFLRLSNVNVYTKKIF